MIRTVEKIKISETTTSFRVDIDKVNPQDTLDERYQRHQEEIEKSAEQPPAPELPESDQI